MGTHRMQLSLRIAAVAALLTTQVVAAGSVRYDYDQKTDFASFERFAWKEDGRASEASLAAARIERELQAAFVADGYDLAANAEEADFLIAYRVGAGRDLRIREGHRMPGFGRDLTVDSIPTGVLVVDVYDAESERLVWRGSIAGALEKDPEKADEKVAKAARKLLKKFPPPAN